MTQNQDLNNTCILFDKDNIAQQEAAIKYYNDNGWESDPNIGKLSDEYCIGVRDGKLDYWWQGAYLRIIELPKEYYPIEQSKFLLTENNGETKPYYEVDKNGDKGYKTPIDNIVEDVKSDAIEFAEWIRTFDALDKKDGFWILEMQLSSEELYEGFLRDRERWRNDRK